MRTSGYVMFRSLIIARLSFGVAAVLFASGGGLAEDQVPTADGLLAILLGEYSPGVNRHAAFEELGRLSREDREEVLVRALREGDESIFQTAAAYTIQQAIHSPTINEEIRRRLPRSTVRSRAIIVQRIRSVGSPEAFMDLIRHVMVLNVDRRAAANDELDSAISTVDAGSMAIISSGRTSDSDLIRANVLRYPEAPLAWLGLFRMDAMDDNTIAFARGVYSDDEFDRLARVAAAVAAQKGDPEAAAVAIDLVREYLQDFCSATWEELYGQYQKDRAAAPRFFRMTRELPVVAMLRFVDGDGVRILALGQLNCRNEQIQRVAELVVARRWPHELIARSAAASKGIQMRTLALAGYFHPQVEFKAITGFSQEELERAKQGITKELSLHHELAYQLLLLR